MPPKRKAHELIDLTASPSYDPRLLLNPRAMLKKQESSKESDITESTAIEKLFGVKERKAVAPKRPKKDSSQQAVETQSRETGIVGKELQEASKNARAQEAARVGSSRLNSKAVIAISDGEEDDDVAIIPSAPANKVCFGMLKSSCNAFRIPPASTLLPNQWPRIDCSIEKGNGNLIHCIHKGERFGVIGLETAAALSRLLALDLVTCEARIPSRPRYAKDGENLGGVSAVLPFEIILYGNSSKTERIGIILSQKNCFLVTPIAYDHTFVYVNPHQTKQRSFKPVAGTVQYGMSVFKTAEEIKEEIQGLFHKIQNSDDIALAPAPEGMKTALLKHQAQALTFCLEHEKEPSRDSSLEHSLWRPGLKDGKTLWRNAITPQVLYKQPKECRGGLLADEMGLGKTLSMLALIAKTREDAESFAGARLAHASSFARTRATLIVCPLSVLSNWTDQIKMHMSDKPKILVHHQKTRTFEPKAMQGADIVLTTYALLAQEFKAAEDGSRETILPRMEWYRVILDEAHIIKDISTQQSQAAASLAAVNRWAVTATPVQNGLNDLSALFHFLKLEPFDNRAVWAQYISQPMKQGDQVAVTRLQTLLKMRCLRRTKDFSTNGEQKEALMQMAPKSEETRLLQLDDAEQAIYNTHLAYYQKKTRGLGKTQTTINVLHCINRLRQICLHTGILATLDAKEDEAQTHATSATQDELADGQTCDFCGEGVSLAGKSDVPVAYRNQDGCKHLFCCEDGQALSEEEEADCPVADCGVSLSLEPVYPKDQARRISSKTKGTRSSKACNTREDFTKPYSTKLKALLTDLQRMLDEESPKEGPAKAIVFSQFTSFLDLCGEAFSELGISYARLDGSLSRDERQAQLALLEKDETDEGVRVMLVSTRAGGVGLNLVAASRVFFMEPCWNPSIYAQAIDRCHRIGQTKPVRVVSYVVEGSIEGTMIKLQGQKRQLADLSLAKNLSQEGVLAKSLLSLKTLIK